MRLQGTVITYADAAGGAVLLDDGTRLDLPAGALQPPVRLLHPGQRVDLSLAGTPPAVVAVTLPGMPLP